MELTAPQEKATIEDLKSYLGHLKNVFPKHNEIQIVAGWDWYRWANKEHLHGIYDLDGDTPLLYYAINDENNILIEINNLNKYLDKAEITLSAFDSIARNKYLTKLKKINREFHLTTSFTF